MQGIQNIYNNIHYTYLIYLIIPISIYSVLRLNWRPSKASRKMTERFGFRFAAGAVGFTKSLTGWRDKVVKLGTSCFANYLDMI